MNQKNLLNVYMLNAIFPNSEIRDDFDFSNFIFCNLLTMSLFLLSPKR